MKRILGALVVLILVLPALIASPAIAGGPPVVVTIPEIPLTPYFNPCTGEVQQIGGSLTLRIYEFEHNGRYHANIQGYYDNVTSDGFTGTTLGPDIDNGLDGQGRYTSIANGILKNESGQMIQVHFNWQFFYEDGEITNLLIYDFSVQCVGKPN